MRWTHSFCSEICFTTGWLRIFPSEHGISLRVEFDNSQFNRRYIDWHFTERNCFNAMIHWRVSWLIGYQTIRDELSAQLTRSVMRLAWGNPLEKFLCTCCIKKMSEHETRSMTIRMQTQRYHNLNIHTNNEATNLSDELIRSVARTESTDSKYYLHSVDIYVITKVRNNEVSWSDFGRSLSFFDSFQINHNMSSWMFIVYWIFSFYVFRTFVRISKWCNFNNNTHNAWTTVHFLWSYWWSIA